jgi:hypothetical protein
LVALLSRSGEGENIRPLVSGLLGNYPNPFNPRTEISFAVGGVSRVNLSIYDVLGRRIATLVDEEKHPGEYSVMWDGGDAASGLYLCRLSVGSFVSVHRMLLLK